MRHLPFLCAFVVGCSSSSGVTPFDGPYGSPGLDGGGGSAGSGGTSTGVFIAGQDGGAGSTSGLMFSFVASSGASVVTTSGESVATTTTTQGGQTTQVVSTSTTTQGGQTSHTTTTTTTVASSTSTTSSAPTWTDLYEKYLKVGNTPGQCDSSCHDHTQCDSASDCYRWIGKGEEGALTPQGSGEKLFSWDNGFMPRNGPSSEPQADADFEAWIAAGSLNN
jgi:hypothetical protein